jgi:hypothetical protein
MVMWKRGWDAGGAVGIDDCSIFPWNTTWGVSTTLLSEVVIQEDS